MSSTASPSERRRTASPLAPDGVWVTDEVGGTLVHLDRASRKTERNDARRAAGGRDPRRRLALDRRAGRRRRPPWRHPENGFRANISAPSIRRAPTRPSSWQLLSVVYDGLVGFKRVGGADGNTLVPDLASALPDPTDNDTTYTFRLREGIKFADGSELKASAVRYSLERLFKVHSPRPDFYEGIVGGAACVKQPERCDLSKGVVTDDDTGIVTIRLREPDPDFLYKLALPFASVVPTGTPADG